VPSRYLAAMSERKAALADGTMSAMSGSLAADRGRP
jgi:hypothetical protein